MSTVRTACSSELHRRPRRGCHRNNYEAIINALVRRVADGADGSHDRGPFQFTVFGVDRCPAETDRRIEATLDSQLQRGLLNEIMELDARFHLVKQALRGRGRTQNVVLETHGYREFIARAAQTGRGLSRLTTEDVRTARQEALRHIWAYSRRQRTWFPNLGAVPLGVPRSLDQVLARIGR